METTFNLTRFDHLNKFAELLLFNGFTLIVCKSENKPTWLEFSKGGHIGYVQTDRFENSSFSTVHKPCKEWGTGFRVYPKKANSDGENAELSIDNAILSFNTPHSWNGRIVNVKKYSSPEEYTSKETVLKYEIIHPESWKGIICK